ncbi:hypothetical protein ABZX38_25615 [Streptomyces longwoodensis]|uniref:hypothetical protein n=1 Tax=Streptomyces longwoodensis TaxID=68231 RepID=UPI0033A4A11B
MRSADVLLAIAGQLSAGSGSSQQPASQSTALQRAADPRALPHLDLGSGPPGTLLVGSRLLDLDETRI